MASTALSASLLKILLVPMVAAWVLHLYQRKYRDAGEHKRQATLYLTLVIIGAWAAAWLFTRFGVPDGWLAVVALAAAAIMVWQRRLMFPYRLRCARCGKTLSVALVLCTDSNTCEACEPPATEGEMT